MTQFSIGEVAHLVNRKPATVRMWHREGLLPQTLQPTRDERGRRYWTDAQVDEMKKWIVSAKRIPGIGLPGYSPTQEQIQRHLDGQRKPRPAARKDNRYGNHFNGTISEVEGRESVEVRAEPKEVETS